MRINEPESINTVSLPEEYGRMVARAITPRVCSSGHADTRVTSPATEQNSRYQPLGSVWLEIQEPRPLIANLLASVYFQWEKTLKNVAAAAMFDIALARTRENLSSPIETAVFIQSERALRRVSVSVSPKLRMTQEALAASALIAPSGTLLTWLEMIEEENNAAS